MVHVRMLGASRWLKQLKDRCWQWFSGLANDYAKVSNAEQADEIVIEVEENADAAEHLKEYLRYYLCLSRPGYALLVTGPWGVGKTWQVRQCFENEHVYYVSLHGATTADDVHNAVALAFVPTIASLNQSFKAVGGEHEATQLVSDWGRRTLLNRIKPGIVVILDDLERTNISTDELTGIVSEYLEQRAFRLVLIADEEKLIERKPDFERSKEKIIGQTIAIQPQTQSAFNYFVGQVSETQAKEFLISHRDIILSTFEVSEVFSLRILRHVIQDVARIYSCLESVHLENDEAIDELITMFAALDIEVRFRRLGLKDLSERKHAAMRYSFRLQKDANAAPSPFVQSCERYGKASLESDLLSDEVLIAILIHGRYDANDIRETLSNSLAFSKPEEMPPWKIVINFDQIDNAEVERALATMDDQFDNRSVTDSGEMLQIFSLRMMLVHNQVREGDIQDIKDGCLEYIDDLLKSGRLPPRENSDDWESRFNRAHGGYVYWVNGFETEFTCVLQRLIEAREQALRDTYPTFAAELLELAQKDSSAFYDQVAVRGGISGQYAYLPVLTGVEPKELVEVILKSDKADFERLRRALEARYDSGRLQGELSEESDWAMSVLELLESECEKSTGFDKFRMTRFIPRALLDHRTHLKAQGNQS